VSRSLRTDPYPRRAARRAGTPRPLPIDATPARPGFVHPATPREIADLLIRLGPTATYGLRGVQLRERPAGAGLVVAALRMPGMVILYEQPRPPWTLAGRLTAETVERLRRAGALVDEIAAATRVDWPGDTLRDFVLVEGLLHEIGHHQVQQRRRKRTVRAMRTADHERVATRYAERLRSDASHR
jgi:hypothetical protein